MASTSTKAAATNSILTPSKTLKGHRNNIQSMTYIPDGQRIIGGSWDKTTRKWDLKISKEIEEMLGVCEGRVYAMVVSRDSQWVVTAGGDGDHGELKSCKVEIGMIRTSRGLLDQPH
jgi:WD40 repeat protein